MKEWQIIQGIKSLNNKNIVFRLYPHQGLTTIEAGGNRLEIHNKEGVTLLAYDNVSEKFYDELVEMFQN